VCFYLADEDMSGILIAGVDLNAEFSSVKNFFKDYRFEKRSIIFG